MDYEYYEIIASELFGIDLKLLFKKTRQGDIKNARFFCMKYRHEYLKFSFRVSGERYNRDHATAINACKKVENWIDTNDSLGDMYHDFLKKCKERRRYTEMMLQQEKKQLLRNIESMGWYDYVNTVVEPMAALTELVYKNDNEDMIREYIKVVEEKLNELKYLYKLEFEPQNV